MYLGWVLCGDGERYVEEHRAGRRKETDGGKDYQMRRWISWGQHLKHPNKGKKRKRDNLLYWNGHNLFAHQLLGVYF